MCDLVDKEPTSYEEDVHKTEWVEPMTEVYQSIMKNYVWDIVQTRKQECGIFQVDIQDKTCS